MGNSLVVQGLRLHASSTRGTDLIPGKGFPGGTGGKELACKYRRDVSDVGSNGGLGRSPGGGGHGNPLQYSCLENSLDRGVAKSQTTEVT